MVPHCHPRFFPSCEKSSAVTKAPIQVHPSAKSRKTDLGRGESRGLLTTPNAPWADLSPLNDSLTKETSPRVDHIHKMNPLRGRWGVQLVEDLSISRMERKYGNHGAPCAPLGPTQIIGFRDFSSQSSLRGVGLCRPDQTSHPLSPPPYARVTSAWFQPRPISESSLGMRFPRAALDLL